MPTGLAMVDGAANISADKVFQSHFFGYDTKLLFTRLIINKISPRCHIYTCNICGRILLINTVD